MIHSGAFLYAIEKIGIWEELRLETNIVERLRQQGFSDSNISRYVKSLLQLTQLCGRNGLSVDEVLNDLIMTQDRFLELNKELGSFAQPLPQSVSILLASQLEDARQLEPAEVEQLLQAIEHPVAILIVGVVYETGIRGRELQGLTVDDVDFSNQSIRVTRCGTVVSLALPDCLCCKLEQYVQSVHTTSKHPLFVTRDFHTWSLHAVDHSLRKAARKLGWKRPVSLNILRRSYLARHSQ